MTIDQTTLLAYRQRAMANQRVEIPGAYLLALLDSYREQGR